MESFPLGASLLQDTGHRTRFHVGSLIRKHCLEAIQVSHGFVFSFPSDQPSAWMCSFWPLALKLIRLVLISIDGIAYLCWTFLSVLFPSGSTQMPLHCPSTTTSRNQLQEQHLNPESCQCIYRIRNMVFLVLKENEKRKYMFSCTNILLTNLKYVFVIIF